MKLILLLALLLAHPAWSQTVDSTATATFPAKSNFRSSTMLEPGFAYAFTQTPRMRAYFRDNQVKMNSGLDGLVLAGFGYRRHRFKLMIQAFAGIDKNALPPDKTKNTLVARRQRLTGVSLFFGYDVANDRNKRVYINAGVGGIQYEYSLFRPTNQVVSFQTILQYNPTGTVPSLVLSSGYWDVNVEVSQREKRKDSFQWVSRIGYRRSFQANAWGSEAYELVGAPQDHISQFYLQIGMYISRNHLTRRNR